MDLADQLSATYMVEAEALQNAWEAIDPRQFARAVELLLEAPRIGASGCGHSGIACMHFVHLMCCTERPARFFYPSEALHGSLGYLHSEDVMLLCSRGGDTDELLAIEEVCLRKRVHVIAVTENAASSLAEKADTVLTLRVTREVDRFNTQGTTSFTVTCVLFDALQSALIERTGFTPAQFALNHPGGAVGKRLNAEEH